MSRLAKAAAVELHSANAQQLAPLQIQCPDKAGEERWIYNIINKTNEGLLMPCSPEHQMVFTLPIPTLPMPPHHSHDEPVSMTAAEQCAYNIVDEDGETDLDKASLPIKTVPRQ